MWRRFSRFTLPLALIALGTVLLNGCLFIPQSPKTTHGPDVRGQVGGKLSGKPIRHGASISREQVVALLGTRQSASTDGGKVLTYSWTEKYGTWIGMCYPGWFDHGPERVRQMRIHLQFDDQDMLRDYRIEEMKYGPVDTG